MSAKPQSRPEVQRAAPELPKTFRSFAKIALSDRLDAELRTQQALADALVRVKKIGQGMVSRMKAYEAKRGNDKAIASGLMLDLWQPDQHEHQGVNFDVCIWYSYP